MVKTKTSKITKKNRIFLALVLLAGILFVGYFGIAFYFLHFNDSYNRAVIKARTNWVQSNKDKLIFVWTDVFPRVEDCKKVLNQNSNGLPNDCELKIRQMIDGNLASTLGYESGEIGRLPIFFIKLKDQNTIEKLYQSGEHKEETVDTQGEKMVVDILQGKRDPFTYPQYNCCGGDDIVQEIPLFNLFLPIRRYLKDFPSEIEQIYLMRNEKNEIIGGLVYLYGD